MRGLVVGKGGWTHAELPEPTPRAHDVVVQVHAAGLNRADLDELSGTYQGKRLDPSGPNVAGAELAGVVERVGAAVPGVSVGDRVMAMVNGAFAERVAVDHRLLLPVPAAVDLTDAAALPVVCMTAYDALATQGHLREGDVVLLLGVTSGVGLFTAALARYLGAGLVVGTSRSAEKLARVGVHGVGVGIDTTAQDVADIVLAHTSGRGADVTVDHVGGDLTDRGIAATRIGGRVVQVGRLAGDQAVLDLDRLAYRRVSLVGTTFRTRTPEEHAEVATRVRTHVLPGIASGDLRAPVDRAFPFDRADDARAYLSGDASLGKVVLAL
ncbi:MAG: zinc-binding dehydrogenase [Streptosporangiales bacterium]|nr:zinc-binding dehydrogenase [Streptosporangiales bacterium]